MKKRPIISLVKHLAYGNRIHPGRDWFTFLAVAVFLVAVSVGWNLWLLHTVREGGVLGPTKAPEAFNAAPLESVDQLFTERKEEELRYKREYRFVDPSRSGG